METTPNLTDQVRRAFELMGARDVAGANAIYAELYAEDVRFQDPFHMAQGRDQVLAANARFSEGADQYRLLELRVAGNDEDVFAAWQVLYQPRGGPVFNVDGISHYRVEDGRIVHHRDHYDLLAGMADHDPEVARAYAIAGEWVK